MRIVVMGVAGSGKTTIGKRLAELLGARFVDADTVHPAENVAKMAAGTPLTDDDRWPWLELLRADLAGSDRIVVAASALKRAYRDVLRGAGDVRFAYLDIGRDVAIARIERRAGHFMRSDLVASQYEALEPPGRDESDVHTVDGMLDANAVIATIADAVARSGAAPPAGVPSPHDGSTAQERCDG